MDKEIQYNTSETKHDWFSTYVLTKEQLAQLIQNKINRAKIYQLREKDKYLLEDWWVAWIGNESRDTAQNV